MSESLKSGETLQFELTQCYKYLISNKSKLRNIFGIPDSKLRKILDGIETEDSLFFAQQDLTVLAEQLRLPLNLVQKCWDIFDNSHCISYTKLHHYLFDLEYSTNEIAKQENVTPDAVNKLCNYYFKYDTKRFPKKKKLSSTEVHEIQMLYYYLNIPRLELKRKYSISQRALPDVLNDCNLKKQNIFSKTIDAEKIASELNISKELVNESFERYKSLFALSYDDLYHMRVLEGKSITEIAIATGTTKQNISTSLVRMCIPPQDTVCANPVRCTPYTEDERIMIISELKQGTSLIKLVKMLHTSYDRLICYIKNDEKLTELLEESKAIRKNKTTKQVIQNKKDEIIQLYFFEGYTATQIAEKYNTSLHVALQCMKPILEEYAKSHDIDFVHLERKFPKQLLVEEYLHNNKSIKDLCRELNASRPAILNNLNFYKIPLKSSSKYSKSIYSQREIDYIKMEIEKGTSYREISKCLPYSLGTLYKFVQSNAELAQLVEKKTRHIHSLTSRTN